MIRAAALSRHAFRCVGGPVRGPAAVSSDTSRSALAAIGCLIGLSGASGATLCASDDDSWDGDGDKKPAAKGNGKAEKPQDPPLKKYGAGRAPEAHDPGTKFGVALGVHANHPAQRAAAEANNNKFLVGFKSMDKGKNAQQNDGFFPYLVGGVKKDGLLPQGVYPTVAALISTPPPGKPAELGFVGVKSDFWKFDKDNRQREGLAKGVKMPKVFWSALDYYETRDPKVPIVATATKAALTPSLPVKNEASGADDLVPLAHSVEGKSTYRNFYSHQVARPLRCAVMTSIASIGSCHPAVTELRKRDIDVAAVRFVISANSEACQVLPGREHQANAALLQTLVGLKLSSREWWDKNGMKRLVGVKMPMGDTWDSKPSYYGPPVTDVSYDRFDELVEAAEKAGEDEFAVHFINHKSAASTTASTTAAAASSNPSSITPPPATATKAAAAADFNDPSKYSATRPIPEEDGVRCCRCGKLRYLPIGEADKLRSEGKAATWRCSNSPDLRRNVCEAPERLDGEIRLHFRNEVQPGELIGPSNSNVHFHLVALIAMPSDWTCRRFDPRVQKAFAGVLGGFGLHGFSAVPLEIEPLHQPANTMWAKPMQLEMHTQTIQVLYDLEGCDHSSKSTSLSNTPPHGAQVLGKRFLNAYNLKSVLQEDSLRYPRSKGAAKGTPFGRIAGIAIHHLDEAEIEAIVEENRQAKKRKVEATEEPSKEPSKEPSTTKKKSKQMRKVW